MFEQAALGVIRDFKQRFKLAPMRGFDVLQDEVLPQLDADDLRFRVLGEEGHRKFAAKRRDCESVSEYNRKFLTGVKAVASA